MPTAIDWSIRNLDDDELFQPQFPMLDAGVNVTVGGVHAEQVRFGEQDPIVQWISGKARVFTFGVKLYSTFAEESLDVQDLLDQLELLAVKDDTLGRPPICLFRFGSTISEIVLVESVDPTIVSVEPLFGGPREVDLSMTMRKYVPFSQKQIDPTKPTKESFHKVVAQAEQMWEAIAKHYYGDPMLGDRLRKRHPQYGFAPSVGAVVNVPARAVVITEPVEPAFHGFDRDDPDAQENYERVLSDRNSRQIVEVK